MRISGMTGMSLLISPSFWTYTANIGIWQCLITMYPRMFYFILAGDSTSYTLDFMMQTWSISFKVGVPQSIKDNEMNDTEGVSAR